jgi:hypothetical protein
MLSPLIIRNIYQKRLPIIVYKIKRRFGMKKKSIFLLLPLLIALALVTTSVCVAQPRHQGGWGHGPWGGGGHSYFGDGGFVGGWG